jgi:hypothetical protein
LGDILSREGMGIRRGRDAHPNDDEVPNGYVPRELIGGGAPIVVIASALDEGRTSSRWCGAGSVARRERGGETWSLANRE